MLSEIEIQVSGTITANGNLGFHLFYLLLKIQAQNNLLNHIY
jgi:hypothetical protein